MNPIVLDIVEVLVTIFVLVIGLGVFTRAAGWKIDRSKLRSGSPTALDDDRLRHLEQAVDAIAVEVERISEAQRFSARLLAERETDAARRLGS